MKPLRIIIFFISSFLAFSATLTAQDETTSEEKITTTDSTKTNTIKYGIRLGTDVIKLVRTAIDDDYTGFEVVGDYRVTKRWFVAGTIGNEKRDFRTDYLDVTTKGNYFKVGADYNMHDNLISLDNMIYTGLRVGYSNFSQTINKSTVYDLNQYWQPTTLNDTKREFNGLSALWFEVIMGLKAEVLTNLYVGINMQLKYLINQDEPDNFANLFIPGVNKIFEDSKVSTGLNYSIAYRIPIYKK